nr:probable LRR receptor-like serine/threonine-protein kinase At1g53420 isoform X3 [Ipomoea trifida]
MDRDLEGNELEGSIPPFLGNMKLDFLDLSSNSFSGSIPTQLGSLVNLETLDLSENLFNGSIPMQLGSLVNLTYLDLSDNLLSEGIPIEVGNLKSLMTLDFSDNQLSGPLPDQLGKLSLLRRLNVRGNNLTGRIPDSIGQLGNLTRLILRKCLLGGPIPPIIWNLPNLYSLDLSFNSLFGEIPKYVSSPPEYLFLQGNKLNGTIPKWIMNSTWNMNFFSSLNSSDKGTPWEHVGYSCSNKKYPCRVFDVDIQGKNELKNFNIEKEAEGVNKAYIVEIENVIVNNSRLEIHLYWSGKGSLMYQGPLISAISVYPSKEGGLSPPKMAAISLSVLILLIVLIVYFWKMEDNSHEGMVELYPGGLYNFQKVKVAAKNFKDKLGEGGFGTFYEAKLGNGTVVAVEKVSATKDIIRAFREKDSTISLMEHPNLVKLMGCIAEKNQLLLVYEDIGHNSLQNALFGSNKLKLDWPTRRNICLGIAEGLAFLHECKQKNVHGNIKPTSIFLDMHLNAKIADFGFSRLHDQGKSLVDGTVVYLAPEYAKYDLLTPKADVYSFGVLVLIVVSGKKEKISSSGADTEYLPDMAVREKKREGHFMNLVDKNMSNTMDWNQAETMLELALLCLDQYPDQRPTMSQVVKVIKEQLPLKDLKESLKQLSSVKDPQPHGEISTTELSTHHSKSRSTSRGGMTDTSVSVSPRTGSNA